jgi:hypothetical protein
VSGTSRSRVPLWTLIVAVFLVGILGGAVVVLLLTGKTIDNRTTVVGARSAAEPSSALSVPPSSRKTSAASIRPPTQAPTVPPTSHSAPPPRPTAARTPVSAPHGSFAIQGLSAGRGFGQDSLSDTCSRWTLHLVNNSDIEVRRIKFTAVSADFTDFTNYDSKRQDFPKRTAKNPTPLVLDLSVPAHSTQDVRFSTCTPTPSPGGSYTFAVTPADEQLVTWVTGYETRVCLDGDC